MLQRDHTSCNTYNYGDSEYWDTRYIQESGCFDWYQRYSSLRSLFRLYFPSFSSPLLVVGCGNALMSEDMVEDGYEDVMNIDISVVAIEMMKRKHAKIPQLKYMQLDVKNMKCFANESFHGVIDKGTLDSLMCGCNAPESVSQMLGEASRVLKPGGIYMLITYGDPRVRMPHLSLPVYNWEIVLYIMPRPGFTKSDENLSMDWCPKAITMTEDGLLPSDFVLEDPDSHFIYVCRKMGGAV